MPTHGEQTLIISDLQLLANLGILHHEKLSPQRIVVNATISKGQQPLLPLDDDIDNVLDYRRVHDAIIDTCQASHTLLLETLTGKVCHALMQIDGVQSVRVKITKPDIFDDCAVSIEQSVSQK